MRSWLVAAVVVVLTLGTASAASALEQQDVAAFVESYAAEHMDEAHVPGLVFVMVDPDGVLVAEAIGAADMEAGRDMTVDTPLRVGSVSKPVTAALALELAAEGTLDLDAPVDDYLDEDLSDRYGPASTVRQLLTHRGGYEDAFLATHHVDSSAAVDLDRWVSGLGGRPQPPGVVASYSSVGYTLAGAAIARAGDGEFADVAEQRLFERLGMTAASFRQPAPDDVAVGYDWSEGGYRPYPIDVPELVPGAGLVATGRDMATFMRAILDPGSPLHRSTRAGMITRQGPADGLRGYTMGLTEWRYDARSVLYHEGNGIGTTNRLMILPDLGIGVFTAVNGEALVGLGAPSPQNRFVRDLHEQLVERFLDGSWALEGPATADRPAMDIGGTYLPSRIDTRSLMHLEGLVSQFEVSVEGSEVVAIDGTRYQEEREGAYIHGSDRVVFVDSVDGVYATRGGTSSYRQAAWWETAPVAIGWLGGAVILLLAGVVVGRRSAGALTWPAMLLALGLATTFVLFIGFGLVNADAMELFTGIPAILRLGQVAAASLVVVGVGLVILSLRSRVEARPAATACASMVATASLAMAGWAWIWGLLPM